jgi:plastocyanin
MKGGDGIVRSPKRVLFVLALVLGVVAAALPALAVSESSPTIVAENHPGVPEETHSWGPATATVAENGVVTFENPSATVPHGINWVTTPAGVKPVCDAAVPVGTEFKDSGTSWHGTCTFSKPGTYLFYCSVHGPEMTGTVTVNANGTTTTTMTMGTTGTTTTAPVLTGATPALGSGAAPLTSGSPLAGSASSAIKLAASQHGSVVHGSVAVSAAGAGGRLQVELLAKRASVASTAGKVQVGRSLHTALHAGTVSFTVALTAKAKRALRHAHRLALTVQIVLSPAQGAAVTVNRSVVLHA